MRQVQTLVDRGYAEIVLTGVHLGEYGTDLPTPVTLNDVVRQILERTTLPRLRLSSIWPTAVDGELIDLFGNHAPRLCRYTHLAVQHGDDQLLGAMRRTYTAGQAGEVVERLVDAVPDICIGADVMVGFPGETDASFQRMYDWLDRQPYAYFHVFSYSKRDHTRAARMPDQVPPPTARERSQLLRTLSDRKSAAYNSRFRGRKLLVLVEEESDEGMMTGRTDHGLRCWFEGRAEQVNTFVEVEVDATDARGATGRLSVPDARGAGANDTVPAIGGAIGRVPVADATLELD